MKTQSFICGRRMLAIMTSMLSACATAAIREDAQRPHPVAADNQAGIWVEGRLLYEKRQFLAAADLFVLAYKLKPAQRISQNIGMAYLKAGQLVEYPVVLRLEYVRRALPFLRAYRAWLANDYGRRHNIVAPLAETDQRIVEAQLLERDLSNEAASSPKQAKGSNALTQVESS